MKQKKFEREIKSLIYYIREYGIQHVPIALDDMQRGPQKHSDFIASVHEGFSIAQNIVIENLRSILVEKKETKQALKEVHRNKDKEQQAFLSDKLKTLDYQEFAFRKIIDSIAWHFMDFEITSIRRLYMGHTVIDITDSNLESCIRTVRTLTIESPGSCAIISDLSSFVQVGDILYMNPDKGIKIIEVKEGKENAKISNIINEYTKTKCDRYLYFALENETPKFKDQFNRYTEQIITADNAIKTIRTGEGFDKVTGLNITISQEEIALESFEEQVRTMLEKCSNKGYEFTVIEGCLLLGVYDTSKYSSKVFNDWVNAVAIKTAIFDIRQSFFDPVGYPLYLHDFSTNDIMSIITGKKVVKMTIDIDQWLKPLINDGFTYRWMTTKETTKLKQKAHTSKLLLQVEGRGVAVSKDDFSLFIGEGMFARMFEMFNKPSSLIKYNKEEYRVQTNLKASK
jgi:hypothetical protein